MSQRDQKETSAETAAPHSNAASDVEPDVADAESAELPLEPEVEAVEDDLPDPTAGADRRHDIICKYLHLVPSVVRKFRDSGEPFDDLIQVGYIGLIKAVNSFDRKYKVKFPTYAIHFITGEIRHYLRDKADTIKKPRWLSGLSRRIAIYIETFLQAETRLPTIAEIAHGINVSEEGVVEILKARSLTDVAALDESIAVGKIRSLRYETFRLPLEDSIALQQTVEKLKQIEQRVVYLFFYQDLTQTEIAKTMGVSQKKVSRLLQRAVDKLREIMTRELW